jgi:hypothetical protein
LRWQSKRIAANGSTSTPKRRTAGHRSPVSFQGLPVHDAQRVAQLRLSALNAMKTANELEREWTASFYGTGTYAAAADKYKLFVENIEQIRRDADPLFLDGWQRDVRPSTADKVGG